MKHELICSDSCGHRAEIENYLYADDKELEKIGFCIDPDGELRCEKCYSYASADEIEDGK